MMYPYGEYLVRNWTKPCPALTFERNRTKAAAIIEARPDYFLKPVIRNVMAGLGDDWNLHVFCTHPVHAHLSEEWPEVRYHLFPPEVQRWNGELTNELCSAAYFWMQFHEDQIFYFQLDSLIVGDNLKDFDGYDYIGAPCGTLDANFMINGGSSIRNRDVMMSIAKRYTRRQREPEDNFYTRCCRNIGAKLPDFDTACAFSLESIYKVHPFAVHGTDKGFHDIETAKRVTKDARCERAI